LFISVSVGRNTSEVATKKAHIPGEKHRHQSAGLCGVLRLRVKEKGCEKNLFYLIVGKEKTFRY